MKKMIWIAGLLLSLITTASAQYTEAPEKTGFDKSKLFFGGNLGLSFGSYTVIDVAPQIGYHFTEHFAAGFGVNYIYYHYKDDYLQQSESQSYAGFNIFGRVYPIQQFFIQAQPELNYVWGKYSYYGDNAPNYKFSQFVPSLLLGGGAALPAGRGAIVISVLYDVLQNQYSPYYRTAVYGLGYNMGF